jgi:hypothetical protein
MRVEGPRPTHDGEAVMDGAPGARALWERRFAGARRATTEILAVGQNDGSGEWEEWGTRAFVGKLSGWGELG